jgi:hypothetical protein
MTNYYQYCITFKILEFNDLWTCGPAAENVVYTATADQAWMGIMFEGYDGKNWSNSFRFKKGTIVWASLYKNIVMIPLTDEAIFINQPGP